MKHLTEKWTFTNIVNWSLSGRKFSPKYGLNNNFINLKKISSGDNKKTKKNTPNKSYKENSSVITMEKIEEMLEQKLKSYKKNIKSY